ncbi:MAG: hypothetical protein ACNA75_02190 [Thiohalomonadaceae bacterium]
MDTPQSPINRDYVRLLMVMRRFIKEEFNLSIRISDEDAPTQMLKYGDKSRNHVLREMAIELRQMVKPTPNDSSTEQGSDSAATSTARYRGVVVHRQEPADRVKPTTEPRAGGDKILRVYRGRPVYE